MLTKSGREIIDALSAGQRDPAVLAPPPPSQAADSPQPQRAVDATTVGRELRKEPGKTSSAPDYLDLLKPIDPDQFTGLKGGNEPLAHEEIRVTHERHVTQTRTMRNDASAPRCQPREHTDEPAALVATRRYCDATPARPVVRSLIAVHEAVATRTARWTARRSAVHLSIVQCAVSVW